MFLIDVGYRTLTELMSGEENVKFQITCINLNFSLIIVICPKKYLNFFTAFYIFHEIGIEFFLK